MKEIDAAIEALEMLEPYVDGLVDYSATAAEWPMNNAPLKVQSALAGLRSLKEQEPQEWSVFNTGAEVWSGLTLTDALEELTPERLARGWNAVCVIDKDNIAAFTHPAPEAKQEPKPLPGADWTITMRRMINSGCSKRKCTCKPEDAENCIWWDEPGDAPAPEAKQEPVGYVSRTGGGTYFRETISKELAALEHGGKKVWVPLYLHSAPATEATVNAQLLGALKGYHDNSTPSDWPSDVYEQARAAIKAAEGTK